MYNKPFVERVLETIIILHNREAPGAEDTEEDAPARTAFKNTALLEEPVIQYLVDRGAVTMGGPEGKTPFLTNNGKSYYANLINFIQQQIVR